MKKYKIIANPASGGGTGKRAFAQIERLLAEHKLDFDLTPTQRRGHGVELGREAALADYDVVVAAGGDGTVNEVVNGLLEAKQTGKHLPALGVLSTGRGNDFGHAVGIPYDMEQGCRVLAEDQRRLIDIGRVTGGIYPQGRYFVSCVGVGFDAITTIEVAKLPRLGGFLSFFVAVLKTIILHYHAPLITIEYDGQTLTQPLLMISITNGQRLGGGFIVAPDAEPDDGLFDLCIARKISRARMFGLIPHFIRGTQATQEPVTAGQAARITITAVQDSLTAQTDGEILCTGGQRLEIELLPHHLEIVSSLSGGI